MLKAGNDIQHKDWASFDKDVAKVFKRDHNSPQLMQYDALELMRDASPEDVSRVESTLKKHGFPKVEMHTGMPADHDDSYEKRHCTTGFGSTWGGMGTKPCEKEHEQSPIVKNGLGNAALAQADAELKSAGCQPVKINSVGDLKEGDTITVKDSNPPYVHVGMVDRVDGKLVIKEKLGQGGAIVDRTPEDFAKTWTNSDQLGNNAEIHVYRRQQ